MGLERGMFFLFYLILTFIFLFSFFLSESKSSGRRPRFVPLPKKPKKKSFSPLSFFRFAPLGEKNSRKNRRQQRRKQHLDMGLEMLPTLKEKSEKGVEGEEGGREGVSSLSLSSSMDSLEKKGGGPMSARAPTGWVVREGRGEGRRG